MFCWLRLGPGYSCVVGRWLRKTQKLRMVSYLVFHYTNHREPYNHTCQSLHDLKQFKICFRRFGDMVALQKNNTLNDKLEYVAFTLIFILFGLAVVAASLDLLVLRFVTMNTEDERRDEAEALQVNTIVYSFY